MVGLASVAPPAAQGASVQEAVLAAKPAAVIVTARLDADVTLDCGTGPTIVKVKPFVETGTGWLVDGRGLIVTNAHVVDPAHTQPEWVLQELRKTAVAMACAGRANPPRVSMKTAPSLVVMLANGRTMPAEVTKFSAPIRLDGKGKALPESGRDLALLRIAPGVYPALTLTPVAPRIGDPVHIIGFPGVVLSHELLGKSAAVEATVTNGFVSSFKVDTIGQDVIQTDASAAHGNSGGPAIDAAGAVLGVLTFVSLAREGDVVQGFNFLVPASAVGKFLEGTDAAKPAESPFTKAWRAGLRDLFAGNYRGAATRFAEADRLVPGLPDVKRALAEAENPPPHPYPWGTLALGLVLAGAVTGGALAYRRWRRNRFRIKASEVAKMIEDGANPLLLDVRQVPAGQTRGLRIPGALRVEPAALARGEVPAGAERARLVVAYCT
jgi:S1-C subfamily serine protease